MDVIEVLTQTDRPRKYWSDLKSKEKKPKDFQKNKTIARQGSTIAGNTRSKIEEKTGKKVVNQLTAKEYLNKGFKINPNFEKSFHMSRFVTN